MSKVPKKRESDTTSMRRALSRTLGFREAALYPQWVEDVREGRTILSFDDWRKRTDHRNAMFGIADNRGFNCDRKFVEDLVKGDDLMEIVNHDGLRVFAPKDQWNEIMQYLNHGVDARHGVPEGDA